MHKKTDKYRLLIENLPDAFAYHRAIYDQHGNPEDYVFLEVNAAYEVMTGLERKNVIGKKVSEVLPDLKDSNFDWINTYGRLALEGGTIRFENYFELLQRHFEITAYSDEKHHFTTVFRDVTESKQREIELLNNQKRFSQAQLFANMGTWEYSLAESKLYWSDECAKLFRIEPGEFQGDFEAFLAFVHPEDRDYVIQNNRPIVDLGEGMFLDYEHRIVRKDGAVRWVREEAGPIMDESGEITKIVGMVIDITEQREAENLLRGILESQQDLIVRVDLEGNFLYVNDAYCKKFGREQQDLLGKSFTPLVHPDDLESTKKAMDALFREPYRAYLEQRAMTVEGWRWLAWEDSAIRDESGKVIEIQGVGRDITAWKDAEAELKTVQENLEKMVKERTGELEKTNLSLQREIAKREKVAVALRHNNNQLKLLLEVSKKILAEKEVTPLSQDIIDGITKLTSFKSAALYILRGDSLHLEATYPPLPPDFPDPLRSALLADHPHACKAIANREPVLIADTQRANLTAAEKEVCTMRQLRSVLFTPLVCQGRSTGVMIISSIDELHEFAEEEIGLSQTLAGMAALALEKAQSLEREIKILQDLRESESEFRAIFEVVSVGIVQVNPQNGQFINCNEKYCEITGYTVDELLNLKFPELTHPEDREKDWQIFSRAVKAETPIYQNEKRYIRKDGSIIWVRLSASFMRDESDQPIRTVAICEDITDRKEAEQALKERFKEMSLLNDLSILIQSDDNLETVFQTLTAKMPGALNYSEIACCRIIYEDNVYQTELFHETEWSLSTDLKVRGNKVGAVEVYYLEEKPLEDGGSFTKEEKELIDLVAYQLSLYIEHLINIEELAHNLDVYRKGLEGIITSMGTLMSKRDNYTAGHQLRVANLSVAIAKDLGLEESRIEGLKLAAEAHDIGKIGIPAEILTKPGELTDLEYMIIQTHPHAGYEILKNIDFPWPLAEIIAQHHEKIDGSGYPEGLSGDDILLEAKIICVADVVEAMASHRPYRPSRGLDAALEEVERQRGILYDSSVVDACLRLFREKGFKLN